jgi:hypothetical protein
VQCRLSTPIGEPAAIDSRASLATVPPELPGTCSETTIAKRIANRAAGSPMGAAHRTGPMTGFILLRKECPDLNEKHVWAAPYLFSGGHMNKHTKGPWKSTSSVPADGFECYWIESDDKYRNAIADVHGPQNDENEANARLIATAPDFYSAALKFKEHQAAFDNGDDVAAMLHYADFVRMLDEALAKATGG